MSDGSCFQTLHASDVQAGLLELLRRIACEKGRIEIVGEDGVCDTVLISKAELESIEHALDLLSNSEGMQVLCGALKRFAEGDGFADGIYRAPQVQSAAS